MNRLDRWKIAHVAILLLAAGMAGCVNEDSPPGGENDTGDSDGETPGITVTDGDNGTTEEPSSELAGVDVTLENYAFGPRTLRVPVGTTVTWLNLDPVPHTVSQVDGAWDPLELEPGAHANVTLSEAGTFQYVCAQHPEMVGTLVVEADDNPDPDGQQADSHDENSTDGSGGNGTQNADTNGSEDPSGTDSSQNDNGTGDESTSSTVEVRIESFRFSPARLTISPGTTVVWKNLDSAPHTATAERDTFDSGSLAQGETYAYTFTRSGTYAYDCEFHSSMEATIVVT